MTYAAIILSLVMIFLIYVPLTAVCEMVEITDQKPVKCGMLCVIETKGFTTKQEAFEFAKSHNGVVYQLDWKKLWFVDYQVEESEE